MRKQSARYSAQDHGGMTMPAEWVERWSGEIAAGQSVLDLACGGGRHGRLFLDKGAHVVFVDIDIDGVADLDQNDRAELVEADLETDPWPLGDRKFDAVVVTNYLHRPLLPLLVASVAPGGWLIYETFAVGNEAYGHPTNPDYLLRRDELKLAVSGELEIVGYAHSLTMLPKRAVIQHIAAHRPN